jgi:hypothetical protein
MGKSILTCRDKGSAAKIQTVLKEEGIESMISPGSAPGTAVSPLDPFTGLDSHWQVITHDQDVERAIAFLKKKSTE